MNKRKHKGIKSLKKRKTTLNDATRRKISTGTGGTLDYNLPKNNEIGQSVNIKVKSKGKKQKLKRAI